MNKEFLVKNLNKRFFIEYQNNLFKESNWLDKNDIKNYVGGNTLMEIGFAHVLNQKIFMWNSIPDMPYCKTEIEAVKPIIINGDLTKVR